MANLEDVKDEIKKVYLIEDKYVIDILLASLISNRLPISDKPVWLLLIGPSSSGKTALLQLLDSIKWVTQIDTLTTNTFASGFRGSDEASLLNDVSGGVMVFKDFTTLTSMNEDGLRDIMGQLRAIYDGSFSKKTGSGKNVDWEGKVGVIAGGTMAVQRKLRQYSEQGERFINYCMRQPNRIDMTTRAMNNQVDMKTKEAFLRDTVSTFVDECLIRSTNVKPLDDDLKSNIIRVADFCTLARSPVILNRKTGEVEWVPEPEMPARMATMFSNIASTFQVMNEDGEITNNNKEAVYQTAFDSIPAERLVVLKMLTKFEISSTKSLAVKLDYPTNTVAGWLRQLNALKLVDRISGAGPQGDQWSLKQQYREVMAEFEGIEITNEELSTTPEEEMNHEVTPPMEPNDEKLLDQVDWGEWGNTKPSNDQFDYD